MKEGRRLNIADLLSNSIAFGRISLFTASYEYNVSFDRTKCGEKLCKNQHELYLF